MRLEFVGLHPIIGDTIRVDGKLYLVTGDQGRLPTEDEIRLFRPDKGDLLQILDLTPLPLSPSAASSSESTESGPPTPRKPRSPGGRSASSRGR